MRFLFHHRIADRDGQAVHMEELVHALRGLGHEVILVGPASFADSSFGSESKLVAGLKKALPRALYELLEIGHNVVSFARLWRAWRRYRPDAIYERNNLYLLSGAILRRFIKTPYLLEINAPLYEERAAHGGISLKGIARRCQRMVWKRADFALPVTQVLADIVASYGVRRERIHVVPNGINSDRFRRIDMAEAKEKLGLTGRVVLGFTGFVRDWHGLDHVIDMLGAKGNECPDLHLLIVGQGPAVPDLQAQAERLGVADRMTVTGVVERDDVATYVAAFDIALQPAVTAYASPLKLFEYMAMAKPTIAPAQPNIMEVLTDHMDSLLFPPGDTAAMVQAVLTLYHDKAMRGVLGEGAAHTIIERGFTWRRNAERLITMVTA